MFKNTFFLVLMAICWQLNSAEEKFESHQTLIRHGAAEFAKATYSSIEKGFSVAENLLKDLKARDTKTDADNHAIEKIELYLEKAKKTEGTQVTDENFENKLDIILHSLFLVRSYKTKEDENIMNSEAVTELVQKYDFKSVREGFFNDFKTFSEKFTKEVEDFLTYAKENEIFDLADWLKKFKAEDNDVERLHEFLYLFVNIGQFNN